MTHPVIQLTAPETARAAISQIRRAAQAALAAAENAVGKAILCGHLLLEEKARLAHSLWLPWLAKNCPEISQDRAERWMAAARNSLSAITGDIPLPASQLLTLPDAELTPECREARQLLLDFSEGKTIKDCLQGILVEGDESSRLTRALNGRTKGGAGGDRKAWDIFIGVKLHDITGHLKHFKAFKGGQAERVDSHFAAAVEQWPTPVLEFIKRQVGEELKRR